MKDALAAADAFRIDDPSSCAVAQSWANIHKTIFLHGHTQITFSNTMLLPSAATQDISSYTPPVIQPK